MNQRGNLDSYSADPELRLLVALAYVDWSLIPLQRRSKRPLHRFPLAEHLRRPASPTQVKEWIEKAGTCNWGVALGVVSRGIGALDVDSPEGERWVEGQGGTGVTAGYSTGRGEQFLYAVSPQISSLGRLILHPDVELRMDRHFSVIPPSIHESGVRYRWLRPPVPPGHCDTEAGGAVGVGIWPLPPMPAWLMKLVSERAKRRGGHGVEGQ